MGDPGRPMLIGLGQGGGDAGKGRFIEPTTLEQRRHDARSTLPGRRRSMEEPVSDRPVRRKEIAVRLRRMIYTLGYLAAMAVAVGAPWKNAFADWSDWF